MVALMIPLIADRKCNCVCETNPKDVLRICRGHQADDDDIFLGNSGGSWQIRATEAIAGGVRPAQQLAANPRQQLGHSGELAASVTAGC